MNSKRKIALFVILLLLIDQIVKIYIKTHFTLDESVTVFANWFFIRFIENPGAAFGMEIGGDYGKLILSVFRIAVSVLLGFYISYLIRKQAPKGVIIGMGFVLAGAIGNIIDCAFYGLIFSESTMTTVATLFPEGGGYGSFLHGEVVDMLWFPMVEGTYPSWFPFIGGDSFLFFSPIFNIADSYISIGAIYLLLFQSKYFNQSSDSKKKKAKA